MGVSVIDGTIESAELKRTAPGVRFYKSIVFRLPNGETKTLAKPIAHPTMGEHLIPGTSGRFYTFASIDHRGIHGVRTSGGAALYAYPKNNEVIGMWVTIFAVVAAAIMISLIGDFSIWLLIAIILGPILWIYNRNLRQQGERQFNGDTAPVPTQAPAAG